MPRGDESMTRMQLGNKRNGSGFKTDTDERNGMVNYSNHCDEGRRYQTMNKQYKMDQPPNMGNI